MSSAQYSADFEQAVRPIEVQYLITYTSPLSAGLKWCYTWSTESVDRVRLLFLSDYHEEQPSITLVMPVTN